MKKYIIIGAIVLGVIITVIAYFVGGNEQGAAAETTEAVTEADTTADTEAVTEAVTAEDDFNVMFADIYFKYNCVTIADSGNWIKVDSNPADIPFYSDGEARNAIDSINSALGFDLTDMMFNTTAEEGRQSASNDKYAVAWTYSEGKGLEVTYAHRKGVSE